MTGIRLRGRVAVLASVSVLLAVVASGCGADQPQPPAPPAATTAPAPSAAGPADNELVQRLRAGGHVIYLRHPATESELDDPTPDLSDPATQRNLSDTGRQQARQIGEQLRRLRIPVGDVLVSPYHRTREAADLAFGPGRARQTHDLISEQHPGVDQQQLASTLRRLLTTRPPAGQNTFLVSHGFNINTVMGFRPAEAECVLFTPDGGSQPQVAARLTVEQWRALPG